MLSSNLKSEATLRRGLHALAQSNLRLRWVTVEVLGMTLGMVAIGHYNSPADPLFASASVPWGWAAPVLIALRYGVLSGLSSMALLLLSWRALVGVDVALPTLYFVGGLLLTMICGEFSGLWRSRLKRLTAANSYLLKRIERITDRLYMSLRSHDLLQQELLMRPRTLRQALEDMRSFMLTETSSEAPKVQIFLEHLAAHCQIEVAQIVALGAGDRADGAVLARIGMAEPLQPGDALLNHALERNRLAHVQSSLPDLPVADSVPTRYLIAVPLNIGSRSERALLVVERMPFLALHDETLQMIAVLCTTFSDAADVADEVPDLIAQVPGCPVGLAEELCRLDRLGRDFQVASQVVLLRFDDPVRAAEQCRMAERRARTPDVTWSYALADGCHRLLTLMPLAGTEAVDGYLGSLTQLIGSHFDAAGKGLGGLKIGTRVLTLGQTRLIPSLHELLVESSP